MLTQEQTLIFEAYSRMFVSDGWRELVDDFVERRAADMAKLLDLRANAQDLIAVRSRISVYDYLLNLESNMKAARKNEEDNV